MRIGVVLVFISLFFTSVCAADEINGKIQVVSPKDSSITVSGVVIAAQNARIENEFDQLINLSAIVVDDYVEIDGTFTGPGQMMAMKIEKEYPKQEIEKEYPKQDEIKGRIETVDTAKREMKISGITIKIPQNAWLEGHHDTRISIEQILPSYYVECKGIWTGPLEFTASKVELD